MIEIVDVGGSFAKFVRNAHKVLTKHAEQAIEKSAQLAVDRMKANAPVGPDAPHMRDSITYRRKGTLAEIGVFDPEQAEVALYNEYTPNRQPFMRPAAEQTDGSFVKQVTDAVQRMERELES